MGILKGKRVYLAAGFTKMEVEINEESAAGFIGTVRLRLDNIEDSPYKVAAQFFWPWTTWRKIKIIPSR